MVVSKRPFKQNTKPKRKTCPTCGGVECFERPRYFPGQLLTNQDLEAAQRYVIEKNKLHNRYLVGQGVVCGLAVRCHPCCDGSVIIKPGYAIDCCGNDIVLCDSAEFNLVEYLEACRQAEEPDCYDKIRDRSSLCDDVEKKYCLILSYAEKTAKPVTALIHDNGCTANRCEPSRIQETFRFDLVPEDDVKEANTQDFWDRVQECNTTIPIKVGEFLRKINEAKNFDVSEEQRHKKLLRIFCDIKAYILELYEKHPKVRCNLRKELREIEENFPSFTDDYSASQERYLAQRNLAFVRMGELIVQFYIDCICNALLVPCKKCDSQEGVLLACLTLQGDKIIKICNTVRKPVVSGPALQYWLQPLYTSLGNLVNSLCCIDFKLPQQREFDTVNSTLKRSEAAFRIARDVPPNFVANLQNFALSQVVNPEVIVATDVYNRPLSEVESMLGDDRVTVNVRRATTTAEAYALGNLTAMSWTVPPGSQVEVVVSPENLVTCIRVIEEEEE